MNVNLGKYLETLVLPPGGQIILLCLGLLLLPWSKRVAALIIILALVSLYLLSTPFFARALMAPLQHTQPLTYSQLHELKKTGQAIVVLSGGLRYSPEWQGVDVGDTTLHRLRYAALLAKQSQLPVLTSGGRTSRSGKTESDVMQKVLQQSFGVQEVWREGKSDNTYENALYSKPILQKHDVKQFYLVTNAWHMPRALWSFQHVGLNPIPAAMGFVLKKTQNGLLDWLPQAYYLNITRLAIHEYLGMMWYRMRYG